MRKITTYLLLVAGLMACANPQPTTQYLAAETNLVVLYTTDNNGKPIPVDTLPRQTRVEVIMDEQRFSVEGMLAIRLYDKTYFLPDDNLTPDSTQVVQEQAVRMLVAASLIDDTITSHVSGLARKDSIYTVLGYDYLLPNGKVNRYLVEGLGESGYVYSKYCTTCLTHTAQPTANDRIHEQVRNPFGGGKASECDYMPVEKPNFANNPMPRACYSLYLNISPAVIGKIDEYIALAKQTKINTFVIDIKDNECPGYKAEAMAIYSPTNHKWAGKNKAEMYQYAVKRLHAEGFYVVGRITCFKDSYFVKDNPQCAITHRRTGQPFFHNKAYWPSAFDRRVWQFNVELAKEAVRTFGFNEINFDYVRFPDKLQGVEDSINYHNRYGESKVQAIQRFVQYACDEIHQLEAYVSIDVFGETANKGYTTPYGQYWPAISNVADVICGMPYPDHFVSGYGGIKKPWNEPYRTLNTWAKTVQSRQSETPSPARVRTWIQAYPVLTYVDTAGISYNAYHLAQEIRGLYDAGVTDGYITWLSSSSLKRYQSQIAAFKIDYLNDSISMPFQKPTPQPAQQDSIEVINKVATKP